MESNYLGSAIRELRKKKKMTLEELADGICSKRQLQRIETNINIPSSAVMAQLSRKLNENIECYYLYSDSKTPISLAQKIVHLNEMFRACKFNQLHEEINQLLLEHDDLSDELLQAIGLLKGLSALYSNTLPSLEAEYFQELIKLTIPFDTYEKLCEGFRTLTEYSLIFTFIFETFVRGVTPKNAIDHKDDLNRAYELLLTLCLSCDKAYKKQDADLAGHFLSHLGYIAYLLEDYELVIHISNDTIKRFAQTMDLQILAALHHNLAISYLKLGNLELSNKCLEYFTLLHELTNTSDLIKDAQPELNATNFLTYLNQ